MSRRAGQGPFRISTSESLRGARNTPWQAVNPANDFTHQFRLTDLRPDTIYYYSAETADPGADRTPRFGQVPHRPASPGSHADYLHHDDVSEVLAADHPEGFHIYESMRQLDPRFFISAGDIVYYDSDVLARRLRNWRAITGSACSVSLVISACCSISPAIGRR